MEGITGAWGVGRGVVCVSEEGSSLSGGCDIEKISKKDIPASISELRKESCSSPVLGHPVLIFPKSHVYLILVGIELEAQCFRQNGLF